MKTTAIALGIIVLVCILSGCAGTYFVDYALKRQTFDPSKTSIKSNDADSAILNPGGSYGEVSAAGKEWAEAADKEVWEQISYDGLKLVADFYPVEGSHKYAIMVHGYTANKSTMRGHGRYFAEWGYNVLLPDNRAHGESEGEYIGMGWLDSQDHLAWINMIIERDPQAQITMLGVSMGGATVMMVSGLDLPSNVKCLVEDCGYSSVWAEFATQFTAVFKLPTWPLLNIASNASKRIVGYGLKEASSLDRLADAKVPMLFIHGTEDAFVPYSMLDENVAAIGEVEHEVLRVAGAGHGMSLYIDPQLYMGTVKAFVDRYITD